MTMKHPATLFACLALGFFPLMAVAGDSVDLGVVHRIKTEAFENSQVMDHLFYLTDANGPRLTGSPGFQKAANWAADRLRQYGGTNVHLEPWGPFGRSWECTRFELHQLQPSYAALRAAPMAWSGATPGPVKGTVVAAPWLREDESMWSLDIATIRERIDEYRIQWKGKLNGRFVAIEPEREFDQATNAPSRRYDEKGLGDIVAEPQLAPAPKPDWVPDKLPKSEKKRSKLFHNLPLEIEADYWVRQEAAVQSLYDFLRAEGVLGVLRTDRRGAGVILFAEAAGSFESGASNPPPVVKLSPEPYNRMLRLLEKGVPVELELNLAASFIDPAPTVNVVAEIPGGSKADEVVMLGGHLDSWHSGTGATDNGAGCAVAIEAFRILTALQLPTGRTIRLALWSGEEQGIFGSRAYVREHFANPVTMVLKPEHAKLSGYFNLDNGSGKIRGVYLQGNDAMRPVFEAWLAPFKDLGASTVSIRNTGGTDHESFDGVGLPGFQFIQDPLDYMSRTHHSEVDVYDHAEPGDLMQASAIMASFIYNAATREAMLPRKPLPEPLPARH
jgi:carboxypeptidase Q